MFIHVIHYIQFHHILYHSILLQYIPLHAVTLHYAKLHCITLCCIASRCIALHSLACAQTCTHTFLWAYKMHAYTHACTSEGSSACTLHRIAVCTPCIRLSRNHWVLLSHAMVHCIMALHTHTHALHMAIKHACMKAACLVVQYNAVQHNYIALHC